VKEPLSTRFEISAAIGALNRRRNKAIFFEQVEGYPSAVVSNLLGSKKRFAVAMDLKEQDVDDSYLQRRRSPLKPAHSASGLSDEIVIEKDIDILKAIPVLTHHEKDAGPYLTASITIARDPETRVSGMGIHRVQIKDKDKVGIFLFSPPLSDFFETAEKQGRPLEIAIVNGVHPLILMSSIVKAPAGIDKFEIAGGLLKRPVELIKCRTVDLEVPAEAEFVLEGEVLPNKAEKEGPFGESTGFYFTYNSPVAKIRMIRQRKYPIYQALLPFGGEDFALMNLVWGLDNVQVLKKSFPFVKDIVFSGVNYMAVVQIDKTSDHQVNDVAEHLLENPYTKVVIIVDSDIDIRFPHEVTWAVCTRARASTDVHVKERLPGMPIDPSVQADQGTGFLTSKLVVDATMPLENKAPYEKIAVPRAVKDKVAAIIEKYFVP
jgi:2,5-furandicarboxylate decarboxylase 1